MSDYFTTVGTKPSIKSDEKFSREDSKPELLLQHYEKQTRPIEANLRAIDLMFQQWRDRLFNRYNVAVQGRQSKFRLLETFKKRYLDSNQIVDLTRPSASIGSSKKSRQFLKITTVRLHGFTPISLERFSNSLFRTTEGKSATSEDIIQFINDAKESHTHYVFLLHSFELLYKECKRICDIVFQMYRICPDYCHILLSSDHVNAGKILNKLKFQLQLVFYTVSYGESFFYERTHASFFIEGCKNDEAAASNKQAAKLFENFLDLASLKDVYQAMQNSCRSVMHYILNHHVEQSHMLKNVTNVDRSKQKLSNNKSLRRPLKSTQLDDIDLEFNQLMGYCQSKFIVRRANVLRNHLGELIDHRIIEMDEVGNKIKCLIDVNTCKKFLQSVDSV